MNPKIYNRLRPVKFTCVNFLFSKPVRIKQNYPIKLSIVKTPPSQRVRRLGGWGGIDIEDIEDIEIYIYCNKTGFHLQIITIFMV